MYDVFVNPKIYFVAFQFWLCYCICHLYCIYVNNNTTYSDCHRFIWLSYCILLSLYFVCCVYFFVHIYFYFGRIFCILIIYILYNKIVFWIYVECVCIFIFCIYFSFVHGFVCGTMFILYMYFCLYYTICFLLCVFCHPPDQNSCIWYYCYFVYIWPE